jgi:hypothetical protein
VSQEKQIDALSFYAPQQRIGHGMTGQEC